MLAMDVSGSMRAADVQPNRLVASQEAAKSFVAELPRNVRVGIVAFAGTAQVVQVPTTDREDLVTPPSTASSCSAAPPSASGIVVSLATLVPGCRHRPARRSPASASDAASVDPNDKPPKDFTPVPPGSYTSAAIILLTDGQRTTGADPLDAAKMAADRGVRIYTVGIGTWKARPSASRAGRCGCGSTRKPSRRSPT